MGNIRRFTHTLLALLTILVLGTGVARAALKAVGPVDPVTSLPAWYQDTQNLALMPCVDQNGFCILPPPFDTVPPTALITTTGPVDDTNFPGESFYYSAEAQMQIESALPSGGDQARLTFVVEAAFLAGVAPESGIVFLRTDLVKMQGLTPNSTYRVTHPYGTFDFTTDAAGDTTGGGGVAVRLEDNAGVPAQWLPAGMKAGTITGIGPFLTRADNIFPTATVGTETHTYIGDALTATPVKGSPTGNNFFRIDRLDALGNPVANWQVNDFVLAGRVFTGPIPSDLAISATYARAATSGQVDIFATALPGAVLTVSGTGITTTPLTPANPANGKQFLHIPLASTSLPTNVALTNSLDLQAAPPHPISLVDEVTISQATYNPITHDVTIKAQSRDKVAVPAPTLTATDFAVPNTLDAAGTLVKSITGTIPPASVTVTSSLGGSQTVPLSVVTATPAPVAVNDSATTVRDLPVTIAVLANDLIAGTADPASLSTASPVNGTAAANPDGTVTFTPAAGFTGTASFSYTFSDTLGQASNSATASINVIPPPPAVAPEWVGADLANAGNDIFVSWAASPSIGATYTVFANGVQQQTGIVGTSTTLTGLANNTSYLVSVRTDAPGSTSSTATAAPAAISINRIATAPEWVGAQLANAGADIFVWWPASATPGASYTVFANGVQQQTGITGDNTVLTGLANNASYLVSVRTDAAGFNSSTATNAAASVSINRIAPAPAWMGVQRAGANGIKLWWPTVSLAGAGYSITETLDGTANPTPVTGPFLTSGSLTYIILTSKPAGTYSYTIRTTAAGYNESTATSGSATVIIP